MQKQLQKNTKETGIEDDLNWLHGYIKDNSYQFKTRDFHDKLLLHVSKIIENVRLQKLFGSRPLKSQSSQ